MQLCINGSVFDCNTRADNSESQKFIGYENIRTCDESLVDGSILDCSVHVGVSDS